MHGDQAGGNLSHHLAQTTSSQTHRGIEIQQRATVDICLTIVNVQLRKQNFYSDLKIWHNMEGFVKTTLLLHETKIIVHVWHHFLSPLFQRVVVCPSSRSFAEPRCRTTRRLQIWEPMEHRCYFNSVAKVSGFPFFAAACSHQANEQATKAQVNTPLAEQLLRGTKGRTAEGEWRCSLQEASAKFWTRLRPLVTRPPT